MFKEGVSTKDSRALIASESGEDRRYVGEIVKAAELRAVGFIRDAEQVCTRTLLSMPSILLLDMELLRQMKQQGLPLNKLLVDPSLQVVLFGRKIGQQMIGQWTREGFRGVLELSGSMPSEIEAHARQLRQMLTPEVLPRSVPTAPLPQNPVKIPGSRRKTLRPCSVVIGSSTGGPMALMTLFKALPAELPVPVAVVQHMPPGFTKMLAERLDAESPLHVVEAKCGMPFQAGTVYIAPGGFHMLVTGDAKSPHIELNSQPPESSCRPAVDALFRSSAKVYGGGQHAIVLTGMGRDGLAGAMQLHGLGSRVVVQDAATSTVWGMPGAIAQAGYADEVLPIDEIAPDLLRCF